MVVKRFLEWQRKKDVENKQKELEIDQLQTVAKGSLKNVRIASSTDFVSFRKASAVIANEINICGRTGLNPLT